MTETEQFLQAHIKEFASYVEDNARKPEDKLIMASAMLTVVKAVYLENSISEDVETKHLKTKLRMLHSSDILNQLFIERYYEKRQK